MPPGMRLLSWHFVSFCDRSFAPYLSFSVESLGVQERKSLVVLGGTEQLLQIIGWHFTELFCSAGIQNRPCSFEKATVNDCGIHFITFEHKRN